jgi:hypothetical protein
MGFPLSLSPFLYSVKVGDFKTCSETRNFGIGNVFLNNIMLLSLYSSELRQKEEDGSADSSSSSVGLVGCY